MKQALRARGAISYREIRREFGNGDEKAGKVLLEDIALRQARSKHPVFAKTRQRGRKRRFEACPVCGAEGIRTRGSYRAGSCRSVYCACPTCHALLRWVEIGPGRWEQVKARDVSVVAPRPCG